MPSIPEHSPVPYPPDVLFPLLGRGLQLPAQEPGLDRYFVEWCWGEGYRASYCIGAQWLGPDYSVPLVVTTKQSAGPIDFLHMFDVCFNSGIEPRRFSRLYGIDTEAPHIFAPQVASCLSPLLVVHYLTLLQRLLRHGLKHGYIEREGNLRALRGRIDTRRHDRLNVIPQRFERIYCRYEELLPDTPENRLLKRALTFSRRMLEAQSASASLATLRRRTATMATAFEGVADDPTPRPVLAARRSPLYRHYPEALAAARLILKRFDYALSDVTTADTRSVPPFWLDMSMLFEMYVLGLLRRAYGDRILYQPHGYTGCPDFLCHEPAMVLDTKYMPRLDSQPVDTDIARQLSAYARDRRLFSATADADVTCVVVYPSESADTPVNPFTSLPLDDLARPDDRRLRGFRKVAVRLPRLNF